MQMKSYSLSMENWLEDIRGFVAEQMPELISILDIYLAEARFGRQYIAADLARLKPEATVLEVGAGSMLLSCQLVREGFQVTALEPIGVGFSHFERLRELIQGRAEALGCLPRIYNQTAEELSAVDCFDYAFSINVMEHVKDVALTLANVGSSLKSGASYRFTCPNYLFPYEPHFNIPTLFSKEFTKKVLGRKISGNHDIPDPEGLWNSLNWINVVQLRKDLKLLPELSITFNRAMLISTLARITTDEEFSLRHSKWLRRGVQLFFLFRLHYLVWLIPVVFHPIIDCVVTRYRKKGLM